MTSHKNETTGLIVALVLMSIGGWLLHFRIHSIFPDKEGVRHLPFFVPFFVGIVSVLVTPILLWFARTLMVGYLLNGVSAVMGTILMTYFSIVKFNPPFTVAGIFMGTLLGDILIAFSKILIGQRILYAYHPSGMGRMFTASWWTRHYVYITAAFIVGHFLWR